MIRTSGKGQPWAGEARGGHSTLPEFNTAISSSPPLFLFSVLGSSDPSPYPTPSFESLVPQKCDPLLQETLAGYLPLAISVLYKSQSPG